MKQAVCKNYAHTYVLITSLNVKDVKGHSHLPRNSANTRKVLCSSEELKDHIDSHHKFTCSSCDQIFVEKSAVENHMNTYHRHSCSACDSVFKTEEEMTRHIESEHTMYNDSCPHCEESFPREKYVGRTHQYKTQILVQTL